MTHSHSHAHAHEGPYDDEFLVLNKRFYLEKEEYDWVAVTDRISGLESFFHRGRQAMMKKLIAQYGAPPYLDAGCGTGLMLRHLPPGSVGIDINPRNVPKAHMRAPRSSVLQADIEHVPLRPGSVSTIIMTEVLEHFPNPADVLAHLATLLRPGGRYIGTVPSQSFVWKLRFLSRSCPAEEPFHKNYDKRELRKLLEAQFADVKMGIANSTMSIYFVATKA
ncbi:MAG TPA: class I SAM-dependent methyltransferase [Dehalococcoidia bacterium]|nr:class I SAM-dependent methyltransferase [Dehalococcoidia bacterium]